MTFMVPILILWAMSISASWCQDEAVSPVRVTIALDKFEVIPGEPLRLLLCCEIDSDINHDFMITGGDTPWTDYTPQVWVSDIKGVAVPNRVKPEKLALLLDIHKRLSPGRKYIFPLELHRWCTTELPPGKYSVHLNRLKLEYGDPQDSKTGGGTTKKHLIRTPETLDFAVLEPNTAAVQAYYKNLYEGVLKYSTLPVEERRVAKFDINLFVHSLSAAAARYQLEFVLHGSKGHYWEWWYEERIFNAFMSLPSMEIAENLNKYYLQNHLKAGVTSVDRGIWHVMVAYASCTNENVRNFATGFISRHPEARQAENMPILTYDGWITDGIDSSVLELPDSHDCVFPKLE